MEQDSMLKKLFGEPAIAGLESDAFWFAAFMGIIVAFYVTFYLVFALLPADLITEALPIAAIVSLGFAYVLIHTFHRVFARVVHWYNSR